MIFCLLKKENKTLITKIYDAVTIFDNVAEETKERFKMAVTHCLHFIALCILMMIKGTNIIFLNIFEGEACAPLRIWWKLIEKRIKFQVTSSEALE